jgi:hypothetical protein
VAQVLDLGRLDRRDRRVLDADAVVGPPQHFGTMAVAFEIAVAVLECPKRAKPPPASGRR